LPKSNVRVRGFVGLCGAVMRSHDSFRQWKFELVEEYGECKEQGARQKSRRVTKPKRVIDLVFTYIGVMLHHFKIGS